MQKIEGRFKSIRFRSEKNGEVVLVHSETALRYAQVLEKDDNVERYETNVCLENWQHKISTVGLRGSYLNCQWTSDFLLVKKDGETAIRELISSEKIGLPAEIEKLELSRRYWNAANMRDWKIVLLEGE